MVEAQIKDIEDKLARAEIIDPSKLSGDRVRFGATVKVTNLDTDEETAYQIVGADEADIRTKLSNGKSFVWLRRNLTPKQQYEVNRLGIPGVEMGHQGGGQMSARAAAHDHRQTHPRRPGATGWAGQR